MRYTSTSISVPVYAADEDIEFIAVTEMMEALLILERYFRGAGGAGWPSAESIIVCGELGQPHSWTFPRPPRR